MKKILHIAAAASALVFCLSACEGKLDIQQHGAVQIDDFYQTDDDVLSANAESYNMFRALPNGYSSLGLTWCGCLEWAMFDLDFMSDDLWGGGGSRGDNNDGHQLDEFIFDSNNPALYAAYTNFFAIVYRSNLVLDRAQEGQSTTIDMCRAEARVFRAWAYFYLTAYWGTPPIVDHCLSADEYKVSNATQEELWAFIEDDLTEAIASGLLSEKSSVDDKTTWRLTKQFAQAILGKAYLWQGKYSEAAEQFEAVVSSGKYALYAGDYADLLHPEANFNCESVFQTNKVPDDNTSQGFSYMCYFSGIRGGMVDWSGIGTKSNGLQASQIFETGGWGIGVPTQDLYDAFVEREGPDGYRLNSTLITYSRFQEEYGIRITTGSVMVGDSLWWWKTRNVKTDRMDCATYRGINWTVMRYAEILLLDAEVQLALGNTAKATQYVNMIRERAKLPDLATVTLDDIKIEKRLELCNERVRYLDLVRWGDAASVLGDVGYDMPEFTVNYTEGHEDDPAYDVLEIVHNHYYQDASEYGWKAGKHERLPFPLTETNANPNIVQNPGY